MVDRLIFLELWFESVILFFKLFDQLLHFIDTLRLLNTLRFFLLGKFGNFTVELSFQFVIMLLQG